MAYSGTNNTVTGTPISGNPVSYYNGTRCTLDFRYDENGYPYSMIRTEGGTTATYYYITNLQGDVMYLVDSSGNTVASYTYDPYGNILTAEGSLAEENPLRYRGYVYDEETGFYYLQARYYDPEIERFISADSYLSTGQNFLGYNAFAYCGNNPVDRFVTPTDIWAWASLGGDVIDVLIPFVGGIGETTRALSTVANVADDIYDVNKVWDAANDISDLRKDIDDVAKVAEKINHGNSLKCTKINYGYVLLDADKNIMKFGETINPTKRYTKKYLSEKGLTMEILETGSKVDIHYWQHDMNRYYKSKYGSFPPLNKKGW